jgi:iron complex transport system ATP-binding protein
MIVASGVDVELAGRRVLAGLGFATVEGQVLGLIGPNGSGKSTLLRCLCGALTPSGGSVVLDGRGISAWTVRQVATRVAVVPQDPPLAGAMTVAHVVQLGRVPHRRDHRAFTAEDRAVVADALATVGASHLAERRFQELSGGERQRVALARCLAQRTRTLLLDEPTSHLDVRFQHEVMALVRAMRLTTVVVLHDLNLAARYCDLLVLLHEGRVVRAGAVGDVLDPATLTAVYGIVVHRLDVAGTPVLVFGDTGDVPSRP